MRTDLNLRMLDLAKFHIGVTERGGANRGPIVEKFQRAVDGLAQGEPWCMAFAQYLAIETQAVHGGAIQIFKTESCSLCWIKSPAGSKLVVPAPGLLAIWKHGEAPVEALPPGHVGIVAEVGTDYMMTVEGNTNLGAGIVREGDGVYLRKRPLNPTTLRADVGAMKLVGFLKVFA